MGVEGRLRQIRRTGTNQASCHPAITEVTIFQAFSQDALSPSLHYRVLFPHPTLESIPLPLPVEIASSLTLPCANVVFFILTISILAPPSPAFIPSSKNSHRATQPNLHFRVQDVPSDDAVFMAACFSYLAILASRRDWAGRPSSERPSQRSPSRPSRRSPYRPRRISSASNAEEEGRGRGGGCGSREKMGRRRSRVGRRRGR